MVVSRQDASFLIYQKYLIKFGTKGLLYKLKQNGVPSSLLNVIADGLCKRKQRVVLNRQHSSWTNVEGGVPQGSILGPSSF